ncbi:MAG: nucleotidyltransferase family protein [Anaerolineaceae bacterium]|nr:nucleotidyltransferase family protein [Anaerolineaceae bacterium]
MKVIVLAGGEAGLEDPLYDLTIGGYKALLELSGKAMIQWVVDAINAAEKIDEILLVGLPESVEVSSKKPLMRLEDQHGMIKNVIAAARTLVEKGASPDEQVLLMSGDIPGIRGEILDWMVDEVSVVDYDMVYSLIERKAMESRYPGSKRSYIKLNDVEVCGGDVSAFRLRIALQENPLVNALTHARKNVFKQARLIGFSTLILLLLRIISLSELEKRICEKLELNGKALLNPYAEAGMDVDKPFQYEIMKADLKEK